MGQMHTGFSAPKLPGLLERMGGCHDGMLNMTYVALASVTLRERRCHAAR